MREGACDYLVKPVCFDQPKQVALRVLAGTSAEGSLEASRETEHKLVGGSPSLKSLNERTRQVARTEMDILISAESGTGKELLARLIHQASDRRNRASDYQPLHASPPPALQRTPIGADRGHG